MSAPLGETSSNIPRSQTMSYTQSFPRLDMSDDDTASVTSGYGEEFYADSESEEVTQSVGNFTCFRKLPAEIRLKIWKSALPGPRIMRMAVKFHSHHPTYYGPPWQKRKPRVSYFVASHPPPIGLWVCRESRVEALKEYELAFPTKTTPARTYINYNLDTLFLDTLSNFFPHTKSGMMSNNAAQTIKKKPVLLHKEFSKVRFLVIGEHCVWSNERLFSSTYFPSLETIRLLVYGESTSLLGTRCWDIEECDGPKEPERNAHRTQLCKNWIEQMESLAKADAGHWQPKIGFVRLIAGSGQKETRDKFSGSEEDAKAELVEGV